MTASLGEQLKARRSPEGIWRGALSSSAISTSVSVFALRLIDRERYGKQIEAGEQWLLRTMRADGVWGDSIESPPNMTATLLSYASLYASGAPPPKTRAFLAATFGGMTDERIIAGVLACYGKDLTFSAPVLVMCALAGVIKSWNDIPQLPFELSLLPQRFFRFLQLPVVSYAIPALIAVGILRHRKGKKTWLCGLRELFAGKSLKVLEKLQPVNGGFLEAAPLTAFVAMCLCGAGCRDHPVTRQAGRFLLETVRPDGAWPIDTDLACWVTALGVKALKGDVPDRALLLEKIKSAAFAFKHPFTGARPGGWGWSDLPGAAPDADDTAGNLVALHILQDGKGCPEAERGVQWLLDLQNRDGGMPTFCKGWGKLPFDRSSPDLSAHSLTAFELWHDSLPETLQRRCAKSKVRLLRWMKKTQAADGSWIPLWFGDQDAPDGHSPVYGTAVAVEHLCHSRHPLAQEISAKGTGYLLSAQNADGGWGGSKGLPSKVTLTARTLSALAVSPDTDREAIGRGVAFLYGHFKANTLLRPEPVGLYFARLWYSEELYNLTFTLTALNHIRAIHAEEQV
ncbi:MAG: squalene--hopene cyclase [Tannerella sp.]|jgi:squalene-hopene/tetraprenyl-beta-curcumene cyclase|nr:squalene--hopene cyclase [Tannerella sp.]